MKCDKFTQNKVLVVDIYYFAQQGIISANCKFFLLQIFLIRRKRQGVPMVLLIHGNEASVAQVSLGVSVVIWSPAPPFLTRMRTTSPINLPKYSADHRHKIRGVLILPECDVSRAQMRSAEQRQQQNLCCCKIPSSSSSRAASTAAESLLLQNPQ